MSKKEEIISIATALFNQGSYNSVGVDKIILESKVAKMTFYKYFPSKEKLIESCLYQRKLDIQSAIESKLAGINEPILRLQGIYNWYIDWIFSNQFNGCMFNKASLEILIMYSSVKKPIDEYRTWLSQLVQDVFGELKINKPVDIANFFIGILDGLTINALISKELFSPEDTWSYILKLIKFEEKVQTLDCC